MNTTNELPDHLPEIAPPVDVSKPVGAVFAGQRLAVAEGNPCSGMQVVWYLDLPEGTRIYAGNPPITESTRIEVTDEMVERLAKFIMWKESQRCSTLDEAAYHQSKWYRAIPEAREMLTAALATAGAAE